MAFEDFIKSNLKINNILLRHCLAEFVGTFILMLFGNTASAQVTLNRLGSNGFVVLNFAWGLGVAMAERVSGAISRGHLNPAISVGLTSIGQLHTHLLACYMIVQHLAAFLSSVFVYAIYNEGINSFDRGNRFSEGVNSTAIIFVTAPKENLYMMGNVFDQLISSILLMICTLSITDKRNNPSPQGLTSFNLGMTVTAIGMSFGISSGYAVNPARDFAPRIFILMAGWGTASFSAYNYWFWVPLFTPYIGCVFGAWIYVVAIGIQIPDKKEVESRRESLIKEEKLIQEPLPVRKPVSTE